jgi:hypothetical protein
LLIRYTSLIQSVSLQDVLYRGLKRRSDCYLFDNVIPNAANS